MAISAAGPVSPIAHELAVAGGRGTATEHAPFADVVEQVLRDVNAQQGQAQGQIAGLLTGESAHVHDVVLSVAKADLAFRLVLEIRNRLIASYQDLMRMQV